MEIWRLLDTGSCSAAENMALDELLLELKAGEIIPHTLRFLHFLLQRVEFFPSFDLTILFINYMLLI